MKFENTEVYGFKRALKGMRNPLESWHKNDTVEENGKVVIGENDLDLAQRLIKSGSEHRKFMRQIFVSVDITGPLYWWKEFDTYKVGTVANSCSTMHKIADKEFTLADFSCEHLDREPYHRNWIESVIVDEDITSPHKVWMTPFDVLRCTIEMLTHIVKTTLKPRINRIGGR